MKQLSKCALIFLASTACVGAYAAEPLEEWEMVTTVGGGSGAMSGGPGQKMIVCQKKMDGATAPPPPPESHCAFTNMGGSRENGTFTMECKGSPPNIPPSTMKGEGRATADTMEGKMTITTAGQVVTMTYSGKRIGSCDKVGAKMAGGSMLPGMDMQSMMDARNRPPQRDVGGGSPTTDADRSSRGVPNQPPTSTPKDAGQQDKKDEPKDIADKAVDAAKKAIGGFLPF
jgi:hypothetical protein